MYDLCMIYVWYPYAIGMRDVWYMHDICMIDVWSMYDVCVLDARYAGHMHGTPMVGVCSMNNTRMVYV